MINLNRRMIKISYEKKNRKPTILVGILKVIFIAIHILSVLGILLGACLIVYTKLVIIIGLVVFTILTVIGEIYVYN